MGRAGRSTPLNKAAIAQIPNRNLRGREAGVQKLVRNATAGIWCAVVSQPQLRHFVLFDTMLRKVLSKSALCILSFALPEKTKQEMDGSATFSPYYSA